MKGLNYGVKETGEQFYTLDYDAKDRREVVKTKDLILRKLKDEGKFLTFIGIKVNGAGSNNPLLMPKGCVTPSYKFLHNMNKILFRFEDEEAYMFFEDEPLILNLEFEVEVLKVSDLRQMLKSEGIFINTELEEDRVLLTGNNMNIELEIMFNVVCSNFNIDKLKYELDLENYYLPINSKSITQRTLFKEDKFYFEIYPRIENFKDIMEKL